jgi:hypothetical protein
MDNILLLDVYNMNKNSIKEYLHKVINYFYKNNLKLVEFYIDSCIKMIEFFLNKFSIYVSHKKKRYKLSVLSLSSFIIIQKFADDLYKISINDISNLLQIDKKKILKYEAKILHIIDYNILESIK